MKETSKIKNLQLLNAAETLSVLGAIGGAVASVVFQQVAFASIPLSAALALNLANRRQMLNTLNQTQQTAIAQLIQENLTTQNRVGKLTQELAVVQDSNHTLQENQATIAQLKQEWDGIQAKLIKHTHQLVEIKLVTTNLDRATTNLQERVQNLAREQTKIANRANCLREIEVSHQNVRLNSKHAKSYYNRGVIYQNLGYKEAAIWDYSEAIRLNHLYAEAYQNRGLTRAYLGDKRGAVEDLREAAKLFFAEGDITSYQMAKDLSIKFHELSSVTEIKTPTEAIESLFS